MKAFVVLVACLVALAMGAPAPAPGPAPGPEPKPGYYAAPVVAAAPLAYSAYRTPLYTAYPYALSPYGYAASYSYNSYPAYTYGYPYTSYYL